MNFNIFQKCGGNFEEILGNHGEIQHVEYKSVGSKGLMKDANKYQDLSLLGPTQVLTDKGLSAATTFIGALCGKNGCSSRSKVRG